jgi:hypothetical protein
MGQFSVTIYGATGPVLSDIQQAHACQYDAYLTRSDLDRVAAMAQHVSETRRMLEGVREVPPAFPQIDNPKTEDR